MASISWWPARARLSGTEAARGQPARPDPPAHDAFTRLRHRLEPDPAALWAEAAPLVRRDRGILVLDDSTPDKPDARRIGLVTRHWSGKHRRVVQGINLLTLLWTDGDALLPADDRRSDRATDGLTKHDHFRVLLVTAQQRDFRPACVVFDRWYASRDNLKAVRNAGWRWLTRLKGNRLVTPDGMSKRPLAACAIAETGTRVHLQGYGVIQVFRLVAPDGDTEHWATSDLALGEVRRVQDAEWAWGIEEYHRGLKQHCGVERAQVRAARAPRVHIGCAIRACLRLEWHRQTTGVSWWEAKTSLVREAVRAYLAAPRYTLPPLATA